MTRQEKRWRAGDDKWQAMLAADEAKAKAKERPPETQCCFGSSPSSLRPRCRHPARWADTFYGYMTGLSWCRFHGRRKDDYPHRSIRIAAGEDASAGYTTKGAHGAPQGAPKP